MDLVQIANLLSENFKDFRNSSEGKKAVEALAGRPVDGATARDLIRPLIAACKTRGANEHVIQRLERSLQVLEADALGNIRRQSHMSRIGTGSILNQETADAMFVFIANRACMPLDLGMYTTDLR